MASWRLHPQTTVPAADRVTEFPGQCLVNLKGRLHCNACNQDVAVKKRSSILRHIDSGQHKLQLHMPAPEPALLHGAAATLALQQQLVCHPFCHKPIVAVTHSLCPSTGPRTCPNYPSSIPCTSSWSCRHIGKATAIGLPFHFFATHITGQHYHRTSRYGTSLVSTGTARHGTVRYKLFLPPFLCLITPAPISQPPEWACATCTYLNPNAAGICAMCGAMKGAPAAVVVCPS